MSNGALFPPRDSEFTKKGRSWRKVMSSKDRVFRRDRLDGSVELSKVWVLKLECGHTATIPPRTHRPPDRVICKACEKTA